MIVTDLAKALSSATTERPAHRFLKQYPLLISRIVKGITVADEVVAEFRFGTDYRADFVAIGGFSGGWDIHFIELEPPAAPLFTSSGRLSKRLNEALTQIATWRMYIEKHRDVVLHELSKHFMKEELVWRYREEPMDSANWPLYHPKSLLNWKYHIIIGRRLTLSPEHLELRSTWSRQADVDIMSYDRLVDVAPSLQQK